MKSEISHSLLLLFFETGGRKFAFQVLDLVVVCRLLKMMPLEGRSDFFEGLVNLRGEPTPVINLSQRLSLPVQTVTPHTRLITLKTLQGNISVQVDQVQGVRTLDSNSLQAPPASLSERFFKQVYQEQGNLIPVLNPNELIHPEELKALKKSHCIPSLWKSEQREENTENADSTI